MIVRRAASEVSSLLQNFPAVVLVGPRQVGKTTLALELAETRDALYLDIESEADRARLADPESYLDRHAGELVILDEIQRLPGVFETLRGVIDKQRRSRNANGGFLLLGSASIELIAQSGETLAGRIAIVELGPLAAEEVGRDHIETLWTRGGFPDSYLAVDDTVSFRWRRDFVRTYLERDIPQLGPRIPAETLRRFWTMLAHQQGGLLNAARLAQGLGVDGKTVARYLDLLVDLLLARRLPPALPNVSKRLVRSPKVYLRDSGIVHALLGLADTESVLGHPVAGASWEGFVIENIIEAVGDRGTPAFYRTAAGAEVDLVLDWLDGERWAVEVKRGSVPRLSRGLHAALDDLEPDRAFVVYGGRERFSLGSRVEAISTIDLVEETLGR